VLRASSHRLVRAGIAVLAASLVLAPPARAEGAADTWDLTPIYASDEAWKAALEELKGRVGSLDVHKGRLSDPAALQACLDAGTELQKLASRLGGYAGMRADEDTRESGPQGMEQAFQSVSADLSAATAWIEPEILALSPDKLRSFARDRPGLAVYRRYLQRLEKRRPHVLDADGEELLGLARRIRGDGSNISGLLRNSDIPWPTITLSDGEELTVNAQGYTTGRRSPRRPDRIATYEAFYKTLEAFKVSLAAALSATVQEHVFNAKARHYPSSLHASLASNEVDTAVYHMLVDEVNASLPTLHRYLELRGRILGIDDLRYHDSYPSLVEDVQADYGWENSRRLVTEALAPLGQEYVERLHHALASRWVDVYPRPGKRSGAYVTGAAYDVHPYMLLNHHDDYGGATTLAHEGGHLMHSWYSQEAQPFVLSNYAIFVAEVASTVNEVIFFRHLVAQAPDDDARLALLGNFLEGLRTTVFRQTMFAEFELAIHEMAERGEPLTGDGLNALYLGLLRKYQGHDEGAMTVDDLYAAEWASVPHFHYDFYVYQYATSYISAVALAEGLTEGRPGARDRYLEFLRAGSTKEPVELLQDAGVDMTSPEPIRAAMRLMNEVIDRIEAILK
jgi:oligoendopeptidase F